MTWPPSLQLIGSKALGGAERWYQRFACALAARGAPARLGLRRDGELARLDLGRLPVHPLPFRTAWDPLSRRAIDRLIRQTDPAIVQTYMGRATRLTRARGRAVHVARLGGYYRLAPYRHADAWVGNTRGLCDWMIAEGLPAHRVFHIYNFIGPARRRTAYEIDALRASLGIGAEPWILLTLGRLVPVKGHRVLLDAAARLPAEIDGRPWRMLLVGDGPLRRTLARQAADLGLQDQLIWVGWQSDPGPYLQLCDLVVFPSLDAETLGNVILEAWAWQRPLVTAAFRGAREIARHGEDAFVVPCGEATALARAIEAMLGDAGLCRALVARGADRVDREFGVEPIMEQYLELYQHLARG
jgi:glycosyltransferase involved in cell wall biosynthesis